VSVDIPDPYKDLEIVVVDIHIIGTKFRIVTVYRPPEWISAQNEHLVAALGVLCDVRYPVILLGDYNAPHIDWPSLSATRNDGKSNIIADFCRTNSLVQLVDFPSRATNDHILDLLLTTDPLCVLDVMRRDAICWSDHYAISCKLNVARPPIFHPGTYVPDFRHAQYHRILPYLSTVNWVAEFDNIVSPEEYLQVISRHLDYCIRNFVPKKRIGGNRAKQYPRAIKKLLLKRKVLWSRRLQPGGLERYRTFAERVKTEITAFETAKERAIVADGSLNSFYRFTKSQMKSRASGIAALKRPDDTWCITDHDKAALLSENFATYFITDDGNEPDFPSRVPPNVSISEVLFTPEKVRRVLAKLPKKYSRTPDGYPAAFLKNLSTVIAEPVATLFTICFRQGILPDIWKTALVTPVFKRKGSASNPQNYRPISLTCFLCKVFETIMREDIAVYLYENELISREQYGFLAKRSTTTQLLSTFNFWTKAVDERHSVDAIFLDFTRAFDQVSHLKLLLKLKAYGIQGALLSIILDFLIGRSQIVAIGDSLSESVPVISGIPQGTIYGPLCFILYINDLPEQIPQVLTKLYADDSKLYSIVDSEVDRNTLQRALTTVKDWASKWQLTLSIGKCYSMSFSNIRRPNVYEIDGAELNSQTSVIDLGIVVNPNLKSSDHCRAKVKKAHSRMWLLFETFRVSRPETLVFAFKVFVRPLLESSSQVWSPYLLKDVELIERVQHYFTWRIYCRFNWDMDTYSNRCARLNLDFLETRRIVADLILTYKMLHNLVDFPADPLFMYSPRQVGRNIGNLIIPPARLDIRRYFFAVRIPHIWNRMKVITKHANNLNAFRACLDSENIGARRDLYHRHF